MIDIHSHILPGIDDGAQTLEESLEMLRLAAFSGTTDIVATPHSNPEFDFDEMCVEELFLDLSAKANQFITLHIGCDFNLNYKNISDALRHPNKYAINHKQYLMVELPELIDLSTAHEGISRLIDVGIIPVITHPERNVCVQRKCGELERWVTEGCLVQVTGQSFFGSFGQRAKAFADKLMGLDLVHFIASDAHDCVDRPPDLSIAHGHIASRYGVERADSLCTYNPAAVLAGDPLPYSALREQKNTRRFAFWR